MADKKKHQNRLGIPPTFELGQASAAEPSSTQNLSESRLAYEQTKLERIEQDLLHGSRVQPLKEPTEHRPRTQATPLARPARVPEGARPPPGSITYAEERARRYLLQGNEPEGIQTDDVFSQFTDITQPRRATSNAAGVDIKDWMDKSKASEDAMEQFEQTKAGRLAGLSGTSGEISTQNVSRLVDHTSEQYTKDYVEGNLDKANPADRHQIFQTPQRAQASAALSPSNRHPPGPTRTKSEVLQPSTGSPHQKRRIKVNITDAKNEGAASSHQSSRRNEGRRSGLSSLTTSPIKSPVNSPEKSHSKPRGDDPTQRTPYQTLHSTLPRPSTAATPVSPTRPVQARSHRSGPVQFAPLPEDYNTQGILSQPARVEPMTMSRQRQSQGTRVRRNSSHEPGCACCGGESD